MAERGQRKAVGEVPVLLVYANGYLRMVLRTRASRPGKRSEGLVPLLDQWELKKAYLPNFRSCSVRSSSRLVMHRSSRGCRTGP